MKCVATGRLGNTTECSHAMGVAVSLRERAAELSPGCVRAKENALWTRAAATTVRPAGSRNVSR